MAAARPLWLAPLLKVMGVTLALALLARLPVVSDLLHVDHLKGWAHTLGWRGACLLVCAGTLAPLAFVPRWPLAVLFGLAYGTGAGVALASVTGLMGAMLQYGFASALVSRRERAALESLPWYRALRRAPSPFMIVLSIRLFPLSNFTLTNLMCGLLRVKFRLYVAASVLGMLPSTVIYVLAGCGVTSASLRPTLWALALATLLVPAMALWSSRRTAADIDAAG